MFHCQRNKADQLFGSSLMSAAFLAPTIKESRTKVTNIKLAANWKYHTLQLLLTSLRCRHFWKTQKILVTSQRYAQSYMLV